MATTAYLPPVGAAVATNPLLALPHDVLGEKVFSFLGGKEFFWWKAQSLKACRTGEQHRSASQHFLGALAKTTLHSIIPLNRASSAYLIARKLHSLSICFPWTCQACPELLQYLSSHGQKATSVKFDGCNNLTNEDAQMIAAIIGGPNSAVSAVTIDGCNPQVQRALFTSVLTTLPGLSYVKVVDDFDLDKRWFTEVLTRNMVQIELLSSFCMTSDLLINIAVACPQLKVITVSNATCVGNRALQALAQNCRDLESVMLYDCEVTYPGVATFCVEAPTLSLVHTFHIEGPNLRLTPEIVRQVACTLTNLRHFSVGGDLLQQSLPLHVSKAFKGAFAQLARNCQGIRTMRLDWETLKVLLGGDAPLLRLFPFEDLTMDGYIVGMNRETFGKLATDLAVLLAPSLRRLALNVPAAYGDAFLSALAPCQLLESVHFRACCNLTDVMVMDLIAAHPRLHTVRLEGAEQLTDDVLTALSQLGDTLKVAAFPHSPRMGCNVSDEGAFAELTRRCPNLTEVDLSYSANLRDTSVAALAARCPRLQYCSLAHAARLSFTVLRELCVKCRHLQQLHVSKRCVAEAQVTELQALHELTRLKITVC
jgi:hypothetical protein